MLSFKLLIYLKFIFVSQLCIELSYRTVLLFLFFSWHSWFFLDICLYFILLTILWVGNSGRAHLVIFVCDLSCALVRFDWSSSDLNEYSEASEMAHSWGWQSILDLDLGLSWDYWPQCQLLASWAWQLQGSWTFYLATSFPQNEKA